MHVHHVGLAEQSARDARLIGNDDAFVTGLGKLDQGLGDTRQDANALRVADKTGIFHERPVAIKESRGLSDDGLPGRTAES